MATDLGQGKSPPTAKYENFVQAQLARAEGRIRTLDLTAALLGFAAATLVYGVIVALLDRLLELPAVVRQGACVVYLLAALAYLTAYVFAPLSRRINPYFAARQLERSLPGSKNSVVNWLDLHEENLPPAIRGAVGQRAAKDLGQADLEKAVSARRAYSAAGVTALGGLAFLIALFTLGPGMFFAHLGRAFAPFGANGTGAVPTNTRLTILKPVDGNAVVPDARPVEIGVQVDGRVPDPKAADALKLLFRYQASALYQSRPLDRDDAGRWGVTLPPNDVQDGFWYKVVGGDAETPEYRVRLTPRVADFKAVYQFRPYLARVPETRMERKIEAVRGTRVDVTVHANRELKEGYLQIEGPNGVASVARGEVLPEDPDGFRARLTLDESGQYRICFTSVEGESFVETQPSPLIAVPDKAPVVVLTKPAELKEKPGWVAPLQADGLLGLEGNVADDVGVAAIRLNMQVVDGPKLPSQEYRSRDKLKLAHGGNPTSVNYADFVDLAKIKTSDPLFAVRPGMVLEYWLTAEDACDYPKPNVGESKHNRVQIVEPLNNDKVKQDRQQAAENDKQANDQRQDQKNQKEDADRQKKNEEVGKKGQDSNGQTQGGEGDKNEKQDKPGDKGGQPKPGDKGSAGSENSKPSDGPNQQPKEGGKSNSDNPQSGKGDLSKNLNQAINDQKKDREGAGKNDPKQQPAGDGKDAGAKPKDDPADAKPGPQNQAGGQHDESSAKDQGQPGGKQPNRGEGKSGGDAKTQPDARPGENKQGTDSNAQPNAQPGQGKDNKADASAQPGADKAGGKPDEQKAAGGDKSQDGAATPNGDKAEGKGSNSPDASAEARPAGEAKDKAAPENKAEAKGGGPQNPDNKDAVKAAAKADGEHSPSGDQKPSTKPEGAKTDGRNVAEKKPDGGEGEPLSEEAKRENLKKAVEQLKAELKSNDPRRRQTAEEFIRRYMLNADDAQVREAGKKALEEAGLPSSPDEKVAENKPKEPADANGTPMGDKDKQPPSESKTGMGGDPPPTAKDNPKDGGAKGETKGDGQPKGDKPPKGDGKETTPGEAKGGPGNGGLTRHGDPNRADAAAAPPATPETPVEQKASVLQLRKFLDTVDKKVLADAKRDPLAMKKLQEEAAKWLAEHPPEGDGETPAGPQQGGSLGSTAGHKSNPDGKAATDDPDAGGRPLPPPGYRDPYKEFTKLLSPGGDK